MIIEKNNTFEGLLVPAGWDNFERVNKTSLFTHDDEDILLKHNNGVKRFKPFMNEEVRITGDITSDSRNERTLVVSKITKLPSVAKNTQVEADEDLVRPLVA